MTNNRQTDRQDMHCGL